MTPAELAALAQEAYRVRNQLADLTDEAMGFPTTDSVHRWFDAEYPALSALVQEHATREVPC